jgi:chromate reductase
MQQSIRILGIAGSLHKASHNRAALRAAAVLLPEGCTLDVFDTDGPTGFSEDLERTPPSVITPGVSPKRPNRSSRTFCI